MTKDHAFTADETCMNCQSDDTEPLYGEEGQFAGSWCSDCGVLNRPKGVFSSPNNATFDRELQELVGELKEEAQMRQSHSGTQPWDHEASGIRWAATKVQTLVKEEQ